MLSKRIVGLLVAAVSRAAVGICVVVVAADVLGVEMTGDVVVETALLRERTLPKKRIVSARREVRLVINTIMSSALRAVSSFASSLTSGSLLCQGLLKFVERHCVLTRML